MSKLWISPQALQRYIKKGPKNSKTVSLSSIEIVKMVSRAVIHTGTAACLICCLDLM